MTMEVRTMTSIDRCPRCGKELGGCIDEVWETMTNTEYRFYECENGHKITVVQTYVPSDEEPYTYDDWDMMPEYANQYGRFYIGTFKDGEFLAYSEDGVPFGNYIPWGFYVVDKAQEMGRVFTRMNIKQAKEQIKIIEEQHPELKCFIIPKEEAERWGICTDN